MKIRRILLALIIISVFIWNGSVNALAMNTGFSMEKMEHSEQENFLSSIDLRLVTEEPEISSIECFDVNDNEMVAVGSKNLSKRIVSVYAPDGKFKYGYTFECDGDFGIEWDDNNIIIYFVRSDVAALFDELGNNLEMQTIQDTMDNDSYWNYSVFSRQRTINGNKYTMRNNGLLCFFSSSYSQLIKTDTQGNVKIIYDNSVAYTIEFIIKVIGVILFVALVVFIVVFQFFKQRKK